MWLLNFFKKSNSNKMKKFLIVGLGNIGEEYKETRHNIGFKILNELINKFGKEFEASRYALRSKFNFKGKAFVCIKPSTYMNLSGKAVKYWMNKEKIDLKNILIITDDINIPMGKLRLKGKGSSGGHNGLEDIEKSLNTIHYSRLRFGIGKPNKLSQVDYVLGKWSSEEKIILNEKVKICSDLILSFCLTGLSNTMNSYNNNQGTV